VRWRQNTDVERLIHVVLLAAILFLAAWFRLLHVDWDDYNHYHPDERYISWVATSIEWPSSLATAFDPRRSTFNPYYWPEGVSSPGVQLPQAEPRLFAYGHLPLYLGVAATRVVERLAPFVSKLLPDEWLLTRDVFNAAGRSEFRHLTAVGRVLTGLLDVGSVFLTFVLGRALYGTRSGLLAAALLSLAVIHIQLAHFYAVDPYLTFFSLVAITAMVLAVGERRSVARRRICWAVGAAGAGMAIGSKSAGAALLPILLLAVWLGSSGTRSRRLLFGLALVGLVLLTFAVTNPFSLIDFTCQVPTAAIAVGRLHIPSFNLGSCFLLNMSLQGSMVQGTRDVPFVRQYTGTVPFLYFTEMLLKWGLGPILGVVGFAGMIWEALLYVHRPRGRNVQTDTTEVRRLLVLSWAALFFLLTGALFVKFMRYLQPLIPLLMVFGASLLMGIRDRRIRVVAVTLTLASTLLLALAFSNIYSVPHPWTAASLWIYKNVPDGATIAVEEWDDWLPQRVEANDQILLPGVYEMVVVDWLRGTETLDSHEKLQANLAKVARADYLVLASNRNYGVISRLPERYPLSSQYYPLLLEQDLGFEVVYVSGRQPNLFGLRLIPDSFSWPGLEPPEPVWRYLTEGLAVNLGRLDESFTVYDQPLVLIFENRDRLSAAEMVEKFGGGADGSFAASQRNVDGRAN
jgi:hypothetical protein